ncbi:hypothetical protein AMTR_s00015p00210950 [Amborella trichopoda]|uniref:Uncharacterized protein n=1 Tax=Amborella trichopoda TaxID=13333 RepID=W1PME9_AMBTC|nr:hypothetical protein AMTR_s00015p00210950 [Amborella trichopoda]
MTPATDVIPETAGAQSSASGHKLESAPLLLVETEAPPTDNPTEPITVQFLAHSSLKVEPQPDTSSGVALEFIAVPSSEASALAATSAESLSEPVIPSSECLVLVPHEPIAIVAVPPPPAASSPSPLPLTLTRKALPIDVARECATTLRMVNYDKETFDGFESHLKDLEQWGIEASQRELEVQTLCKPCLAASKEAISHHQSLIKGYEEEKSIHLSN